MEKINELVSGALDLISFGELENGLVQLESSKEKVPIHVNAVKAEIFAFKNQWNEIPLFSSQIILHPESLSSSNIFFEHCELISIAGLMTNDWKIISETVEEALLLYKKVSQVAHQHTLNKIKKLADSGLKLDNWEKIRKALKSKTAPIANYQNPNELAFRESFLTYPMKYWAAYEQQSGLDFLHFMYSEVARFELPNETVKIYESFGMGSLIYHVYNVALAYLELGKKDEAWKVIHKNIFLFSPEDTMMCLPTELLRTSKLNSLLNKERREFILHTPKGSLALNKHSKRLSNIDQLNSISSKDCWQKAKAIFKFV